jgi:hypothetical protein
MLLLAESPSGAISAVRLLVRRGSDADEQLDVSFLGIAVMPVLAGVGRFSARRASRRLPVALPEEKWSITVSHRRHRDADALPLHEEGGRDARAPLVVHSASVVAAELVPPGAATTRAR